MTHSIPIGTAAGDPKNPKLELNHEEARYRFEMAALHLQYCSKLFGLLVAVLAIGLATAQQTDPFSPAEQAIEKQISGLRAMEDAQRAKATKDIALQIRKLPAGKTKLLLASSLTNLSTEGDFGSDTTQAVADTLSQSLTETPAPDERGEPAFAYQQLAQLSRYEHAKVNLKSPQYDAAIANLVALERLRNKADFTLTDLNGKTWTLSALKGKVVLLNFWATWCPPCRKEMPDMQAVYNRFKDRGLVVLAISDEEVGKVKPFIAEHGYTYPILLDPGRKVNTLFKIGGIPNSFIYDRNGKLVAQAIDGRSERQMLELLAKAGMK